MRRIGGVLGTAAVVLVVAATGFWGGMWVARRPQQAAAQPPLAQTQQSGHTEMDAAHEARVKAFPAKTRGLGAQPIQAKLVGGVKVFELTAAQIP